MVIRLPQVWPGGHGLVGAMEEGVGRAERACPPQVNPPTSRVEPPDDAPAPAPDSAGRQVELENRRTKSKQENTSALRSNLHRSLAFGLPPPAASRPP